MVYLLVILLMMCVWRIKFDWLSVNGRAVTTEEHLPNSLSITNWTPRAKAFSSSSTDLQPVLTVFRVS